jgi:hypothetical protein
MKPLQLSIVTEKRYTECVCGEGQKPPLFQDRSDTLDYVKGLFREQYTAHQHPVHWFWQERYYPFVVTIAKCKGRVPVACRHNRPVVVGLFYHQALNRPSAVQQIQTSGQTP